VGLRQFGCEYVVRNQLSLLWYEILGPLVKIRSFSALTDLVFLLVKSAF
jgi:hypothetical protein